MTEIIDVKPAEILLIEDNPVDIRMTKEAFKDCCVANNLHVATDGEAAIDFIYRRGEYTDASRPDLILLDLSLPKKRGNEILKEVKADLKLRSIPVVILATSDLDEDITRSYCHNANAFITKPIDFDDFVSMMRSIGEFWLTFVELPREHTSCPPT